VAGARDGIRSIGINCSRCWDATNATVGRDANDMKQYALYVMYHFPTSNS
jgi:hypothetical protein